MSITAPSPRAPVRIRHETRRRVLDVLRVETLSPHMRRVVLGGADLHGFHSAAADDHVKLFLPSPAGTQPPGEPPRPVMRDYTPRHYDPERGELWIDFVLHDAGPACAWAAHAAAGQQIGIGGPRGSTLIADDHDAYLLIGDETALPAIARRLQEMQPGAKAIALIEVAADADRLPLATRAEATITWVTRDGVAPGYSAQLLHTLQGLAWPTGDVHVWMAGEIATVRALRSHLIEQRGLVRAQIRAAGYWRLGQADAHARLDDE